ncbi:MAG: lysine exporter LysO family protein [Firmicutes bacterium]|nr:lysine exporter LysO family protein [Bacillota bacterium]
MMNTLIPFICLAFGAAINWRGLPAPMLKAFDIATNAALIMLMAVIGLNIGISPQVMGNLGTIGLNCLIISLAAIAGSVLLVCFAEATVMPLEKIRLQLAEENAHNAGENASDTSAESQTESSFSPLIILMPACIVIGIIAGYFWLQDMSRSILDTVLTVSLIFLYTGVGVSLGENKEVFQYMKRLGARVLFMPAAIFAGCIIGGFISGLLLGLPLSYSVISASGMGYYSLTGAFMTESFGIEAGTYGFIVNVSRDVFTVALLPLLSKISKGSPIASGAAGCMDTMLVPVTRAVGPELGMVALISGTILTFVVPVWLPVVGAVL